jgi:transposase
MSRKLFWLSDEQWARIEPHLPKDVRGVERADVGHDCTVENLNTLGACICFDVTTVAELPRKFDLTFDNCHTYWQCDVIWRDRDISRVGVSWKTR